MEFDEVELADCSDVGVEDALTLVLSSSSNPMAPFSPLISPPPSLLMDLDRFCDDAGLIRSALRFLMSCFDG